MSHHPRLPKSNEELLKQCRVDTFRSSGPGGQHTNTTDSAVRLTHESGLTVTSSVHRSQHKNKEICISKLRTLYEKTFLQKKKKRIPTKKSRSSQERRLKSKKIRSDIKNQRQQRPDY